MRHLLRLTAFIALALVTLSPAVPSAAPPASGPEIRLVLLIAVDQFRYDYLTRFRDDYTAGFVKLLTGGADFTNAFLEHYPSVTAVGHSTMLSGATPAVSGIIGNDWYDRALGKSVTSVEDPKTTLVGGSGEGSSPRRLLVDTVGDELKRASHAKPGSAEYPKVFGLSLKDRAAILPPGHMADAAFWFDTSTGAFVTSTYYRRDLPTWVAEFNAKKPADAYAGKIWQFADPSGARGYKMPDVGPSLYAHVFGSPFGNELLGAFAATALDAERLGQRGVTDLLTVSFSSNDAVGHAYGPDSPEVRDMAIRVDRVIGTLLEKVDASVGLDHTLVILTSDHGVAPVPEVQKAKSLPGGRMTQEELFGPIEAALSSKYGQGPWILATAGTSPYLDHALMRNKKLDPVEVRKVAAAAAAAIPHVARVYTRDQLLSGEVPDDTIAHRIVRSHNEERSGDLEIVLDPYWMRASRGTTHGTPYDYDTHVPLVFMGPRIRTGHYDGNVALNDLAPTVATMLGIQTPAGSQGRVLTEMLSPTPAPPTSAKAAGPAER